jgi:hypothetical protein
MFHVKHWPGQPGLPTGEMIMNILKQITRWRKFELPPIETKQSIPLATAYACMSCRTIQSGAAHGHCYSCGSSNIRSVSDAFGWLPNKINQQLEESKAKKRQKQESDEEARIRNVARVNQFLAKHGLDQSPQSLTEFRVKD